VLRLKYRKSLEAIDDRLLTVTALFGSSTHQYWIPGAKLGSVPKMDRQGWIVNCMLHCVSWRMRSRHANKR